MDFEICIWHRGQISHVRCHGRLDAHTAPKLRDAAEMVLETRPEVLELDCRNIHSLSVSAVDTLIGIAGYGQVRGARVKIRLNDETRRIAQAFAGDDLEPWMKSAIEERPHGSFIDLVDSAEQPVAPAS